LQTHHGLLKDDDFFSAALSALYLESDLLPTWENLLVAPATEELDDVFEYRNLARLTRVCSTWSNWTGITAIIEPFKVKFHEDMPSTHQSALDYRNDQDHLHLTDERASPPPLQNQNSCKLWCV